MERIDFPAFGHPRGRKKIRYFDFISSLQYDGCNRALKRILPRIDMEMTVATRR